MSCSFRVTRVWPEIFTSNQSHIYKCCYSSLIHHHLYGHRFFLWRGHKAFFPVSFFLMWIYVEFCSFLRFFVIFATRTWIKSTKIIQSFKFNEKCLDSSWWHVTRQKRKFTNSTRIGRSWFFNHTFHIYHNVLVIGTASKVTHHKHAILLLVDVIFVVLQKKRMNLKLLWCYLLLVE